KRRVAEADDCGISHGCCGDTKEIYLRLDAETIKDATFMTDGSEPAVACGSVLTKLLKGMSLAEAGHVRPEELINALDGLPPVKTHCAKLTLDTLGKAIANGGGEQ
ncbi:MAG: iron-sulfur cluster assembly scaffold protein, partial [Ardenticatenia bacterium]|nr:iron-sulfur cluster assembly scaffold protein [Ardenticatenia bacterium]